MNAAQRILIIAGIAIIGFTMSFGVWYAIFDEHQTLNAIGLNLASGFIHAATGDLSAAMTSLDNYAAVNREYRFEVHSHGHWGMLALILLILGLVFQQLGLSERQGLALAWLLALSAALFPLGILIQTGPALAIGKALSLFGAVGMVLGLLVSAWGLIRGASP